MRSWQRTGILSGVAAFLLLAGGMADASYVLEITDADATPQATTVSPGDSITLYIQLTGSAEDRIDFFLFDVVFSVPELFYESYEFDGTVFFAGDGSDDFSVPGLADLPESITAGSYTTPNTGGDVDLHFEALSARDADGAPLSFGSGVLARIDLSVPAAFQGNEVVIGVVPDSFGLGFDLIDTQPGAEFHLFVPGAAPFDPPIDPEDPEPESPDDDGDGVVNENDLCADTVADIEVDEAGCPIESEPSDPPSTDTDGDGVANELDDCPQTPAGQAVDSNGCPTEPNDFPTSPTDADADGVNDEADLCPDSPAGVAVDDDGCEPDEEQPPNDDEPAAAPRACGALGLIDSFWLALGLTGLTHHGLGRWFPRPRTPL